MKTIKFISVAAIATAVMSVSCQKTGNPSSSSSMSSETPVIEDNSIVFGVSGIGVDMQTKAYAENTATEVQANGFNVVGITGTATLFTDKATYDGTSKYNPVNGPYYYPTSRKTTFYACYPTTQAITVSSGAATLAYTANPDTDLLVAKKDSISSSATAVELAFDHILSLMRFKAVGSDSKVTYKVTSVKVNAPSSGTYTFASGAWTNDSSTADYTYSSTSTDIGTSATAISGGVTIIPCKATVKVSYDTYIGSTLISHYDKSAELTTSTSIGKECTVTMTLPNDQATAITFTVTVNKWGSETQNLSF